MITNREEAFEKITEFVYQSTATKILNTLGYPEELSAVKKWEEYKNYGSAITLAQTQELGDAMRDETPRTG
jgi:adenylate cyclase class IV